MTKDTTTRRSGLASILAVLCTLVLVGGLAFGLWMRDQAAEVEQREQDRAEVVQAAQRFTMTWNTIDPAEADQYVEAITGLITDRFMGEAFGEQQQEAVEVIKEGGVTSDAKILSDGDGIPLVGISVLDPNSATVLVVSDSQRSVQGQQALRHWRWQLELVKQDGDWLVDDLTAV